ncbi:uncharacterized protein [Clytia hemisphaerica]|uniref:uncharacterized protein n=1 Tax=Clytia hemisphaerica TaxID=252671 RepID=UPI0034D511B7
MATWNVRTLYNSDDDDDFKLKALTEEMKRLKIDILGVSETHWTNEIEEAFEMNDYVIVQSGRKDNIHRQDVAIFITKELSQHMCGYALVNERIMSIQLNTKTGPLFLFQVYTPDYQRGFLPTLAALPRNSRFVVLCDFNGKVGHRTDELWTGICGVYGVGQMNEGGERLLNFCAANKLSIMNTMYKQKLQRLITWVSPDGRTKNQIDYILVPADQKSCIKSCRVFNSADVNSDHSLLMAKYKLQLPQRKRFKTPPKRYDIPRLKTEEYAKEFKIKIGGYFETLINEINNSSVEASYNKFVETVNKATKEVVGFRKRKSVDGLSKDTIQLCEKRRKLRKDTLSSPNCEDVRKKYREINKLVKKEVRKAKKEKLENMIKQLEDDFQKKNSHSLFKSKCPCPKRNEQTLETIENHHPVLTEEDDFTILKEDIKKAIASLKNNSITPEVLKAGGNTIVDALKIIFDKILDSVDTPSHFAKMIVTPRYSRKYEKTQCAVNVVGKLTNWFEVTVGVRQGCLLSPTLFNLFLEFVMDELQELQEATILNNGLCIDVRYADDTTLIAAVFEKLQLSTNQLQDVCLKYGMKINTTKCKAITASPQQVEIDNKSVQDFIFLGSNVPSTSKDVKRRIALANYCLWKTKTKDLVKERCLKYS